MGKRSILRAFRLLRDQGHAFVTTHQNIAEFWNVAARPASARGGFGLSPFESERRLATIEGLGKLLPFNQRCYSIWRQLLVKHGIVGVSVHDVHSGFVAATHLQRLPLCGPHGRGLLPPLQVPLASVFLLSARSYIPPY